MTSEAQDGPLVLFSRRAVLAGCAAFALDSNSPLLGAQKSVGTAIEVHGDVNCRRQAKLKELSVGEQIFNGDTVITGTDGHAGLMLEGRTRIIMGSESELTVDKYIASQGGTVELGAGAMMFDRRENLPKIDLTVRTAFGMIGVRGTKFFCGPSRGVFGVFVERGTVEVLAGGVSRIVGDGEGVEISRPGAAPQNFARWGEPRIVEAYRRVGLSR